MSCDCRKDIEQRLLDRFKDQYPDAQNHGATLMGYTYIIEDLGITTKGFMPIELNAQHPLKKGGVKAKTMRSNMIFTFCPFCGERYAPKQGEVDD